MFSGEYNILDTILTEYLLKCMKVINSGRMKGKIMKYLKKVREGKSMNNRNINIYHLLSLSKFSSGFTSLFYVRRGAVKTKYLSFFAT